MAISSLPWRSAFSRFAPVVKVGLPVLASGSNCAVKPTRLRRAAYFRSLDFWRKFMTTHKLVPILFFFACLGSAQGQVYKCISNGKTIFSDAPCPSNSSGNLIQERQSSEEKYNERLRALEAEQLKQQRRQIEMERNFYERPQEPTIIRHQYQNLPPPPETWAERNERRNREVSKSSITNNGGRWDEKAANERRAERDRNTLDCTSTGGGNAVCRPRR